MGIPNIFSTGKGNSRENLDKGLEKTRESLLKKVSRAVVGKSRIDDEVLDKLEEALISSMLELRPP
jgi:signal recognition particle-docking protein FtsY